MAMVEEGVLLWEPTAADREASRLTHYMAWLREKQSLTFSDYEDLWRWSVAHLEEFWASLWDYYAIEAATPYTKVLDRKTMPGAHWFTGATLNYAQHAFRHATDKKPALLYASETRPLTALSWAELHEQVAAVAAGLRSMGVVQGDRVVAYMPNSPETLVAFLACASLGAVWSSCSPDFGAPAVLDRFRQIEPKVLFAVDGYSYNGKEHDRLEVVARLQNGMETLEHTVLVPYLSQTPPTNGLTSATAWGALLDGHRGAALPFTPVPFEHPLWVLYSSGTTGLPKAIVQGHGGIILEHLKSLNLQSDITEDDVVFWYTTTGWMMWNHTIGALLCGATIVLYDGSTAFPSLHRLWELAAEAKMTSMGISPGFIGACMVEGVSPDPTLDLSALKTIGATGSPLSPEGFAWLYGHVKADIRVSSMSGGSDVCTAFIGGCPLKPVHAGRLQCRFLGVAAAAYDEHGQPVVDEVGELVVTAPMPSMPLFFWGDDHGSRYRTSYFDLYPGIWRHGDWIKFTPDGESVIYGRSDATINRLGVRMGTSDIYRIVESVPGVLDSLVIDLEMLGRTSYMGLFVVLREGLDLDENMKKTLRTRIRQDISPRHVPDAIYAVASVPRTLSGKKLETPVRKILLGAVPGAVASVDSLSNPESLDFFVALSRELNAAPPV